MENLAYYALFILIAIFMGNRSESRKNTTTREETPSDILDEIHR